MAVDYTVIFSQRQRFGDEPSVYYEGAPYVGESKDYSFDCPDVNPNQTAVLMFNSYDVERPHRWFGALNDVLQINGVDVYGGIYVGPSGETSSGQEPQRANIWMTHELLVEPRHQLRATGNVLHVESYGSAENVDDFILDNMVIMYKTVTGPVPPRDIGT